MSSDTEICIKKLKMIHQNLCSTYSPRSAPIHRIDAEVLNGAYPIYWGG